MKNLYRILLAICLLLPVGLAAQNPDESRATSLYKQAVDAILDKDFDAALKYLDEGIRIAPQSFLKKYNWLYGETYSSWAASFMFDDNMKAFQLYDKAYYHYSQALDYKNAIYVIYWMGWIAGDAGNYSQAIQLFNNAVFIADLYKYPAVDVLVEQEKLYRKLNQYDQVRLVSYKLYEVYHYASAPEDRFKILLHLAKGARLDMSYDLSWAYHAEIERILPQFPESVRMNYQEMQSLEKHALLESVGQYEDALEYTLRQVSIKEQHHAPEDEMLDLYLTLAGDYVNLANKEKASEYLEKVSGMLALLQIEKERQANMYTVVGLKYSNIGDYRSALECYDKAEESGWPVEALLPLRGSVLFSMGQKEASRHEYERYSQIMRSQYGESSLQYAMSLEMLANISAFCKDMDSAASEYVAAADIARRNVYAAMRYLVGADRDTFWNQCSSLFFDMVSFGLKAGFEQDKFTEAAYDALLLSKGLLLASDRSLSEIVNESGDEDLVDVYNKCLSLYTDIESARAKGGSADRLRELNDKLHLLEMDLLSRISEDHDYMKFIDVDYQDIQAVMADDEVVVDLIDFKGKKDSDRVHYAAFVYRKGWRYPRMLKLFEESDLTRLLGSDPKAWTYYGDAAGKFLKLIFGPLKKYINDNDKVYWIPSGNLHKISVESLLMQGGDKYPFTVRRLSSARMLTLNNSRDAIRTAVLYGGLQYDMAQEEFGNISDGMAQSGDASVSRGKPDGFRQLPQSLEEVYLIKDILQSSDSEVQVYDGKNGTEQTFVRLSGKSPDLIHLSTHGFYYTPDEAVSVNALSGYRNAMLLSGLVLSGGNLEWTGTEIVANSLGGLLTANDIEKLDLSSTELVVLSACGTGNGEITSEGVYGLQRAFKRAGVKHVIMTLWQVNDYMAKEFMSEFYKNLTGNGGNVESALLETKKAFRNKDPYYWAGYVLLD